MLDKDYPYVNLNSTQSHYVSEDGCIRCPVCGKVFYVAIPNSWAYKTMNKHWINRYMCSWSCLNKAKKSVETCRKYKPRYEVKE